MATFLVIPAAGSGTRLRYSGPKALVPILGHSILSWTLEAFAGQAFDRAVIAAPADRMRDFERVVNGRAALVAGGATRSASVRAAFQALGAHGADVVCIHDAARPLIAAEEIGRVLEAARATGRGDRGDPDRGHGQARGERAHRRDDRPRGPLRGRNAAGLPGGSARAAPSRPAARRPTRRGSSRFSACRCGPCRSRAGTSRSRRPRTLSSPRRSCVAATAGWPRERAGRPRLRRASLRRRASAPAGRPRDRGLSRPSGPLRRRCAPPRDRGRDPRRRGAAVAG